MTISDEIVAMKDTPAEKVMANHTTKRSIDDTQEVSSKFMRKENGSGKRVSFESFPRKVQQLTLNAIPSSEIDDISLADDTCANASIFYTKLVHWDELNMSQGFTELKRAVHKFSNLPMVIFNQHKIRINTYIYKMYIFVKHRENSCFFIATEQMTDLHSVIIQP